MTVSAQTRLDVWTRDQGICGICGRAVEREDLELDHIIYRHAGGSDAAENLRVAHKWCNRSRAKGKSTNPRPRNPRSPRFRLDTPEGVAAYQAFMRTNAARRKQTLKRCPVCRAEFRGWANRVYCSPACNQKAWYYRHKDEARHPAPPPTDTPDA